MIEFLRKLVLRDFPLKIFSLAVAVLLWVLVSIAVRQQPIGGSLAAPGSLASGLAIYHLPLLLVSATNEPRSFIVSPAEVGVTVQADTNVLANLRETDLRALVVLTGTESGPLIRKPVEITAPPGVTWVRVTPVEAQVTLKPNPKD